MDSIVCRFDDQARKIILRFLRSITTRLTCSESRLEGYPNVPRIPNVEGHSDKSSTPPPTPPQSFEPRNVQAPPLLELLLSIWVQCPHWPIQPPEALGVGEVQLGALIVRQHPGEDRVLGQVVVAPPRQRVEVHEVLEIGDLARLPPLAERAGHDLEQPPRLAQLGARAAADGTAQQVGNVPVEREKPLSNWRKQRKKTSSFTRFNS
jgi:hypothetical protein